MPHRIAGELILVSEYNELATAINKVFADNTDALEFGATFSGEPLTIDNASSCNALFAKHETDTIITGTGPFALTPSPTNGDYIVVERNQIYVTSGYTIDYGANTITFTTPIDADRVVVYNRSEHRFGYGNVEAEFPLLIGDIVEAAHINGVIDRTNLVLEHVGNVNELTRKTSESSVLAADGNTIETTIADEILAGDAYITMDAATATETTPEIFTDAVAGWTNKVIGEFCFTFTSYDQARHFFNAAAELHLDMSITNNNTGIVGDRGDQWVTTVAQMSEVIMNHDSVFDVPGATYPGIGSNIGFYHLTDEYQPIYSSAAYSGQYDEEITQYITYSYYSDLKVEIDAKYILEEESGYLKVAFRITLDDTALNEDLAMNVNISTLGFNKKTQDLTDNSATLSTQSPYLEEITPFTAV